MAFHSAPLKDIRGSVFGLTLILVDFIMLAFIFWATEICGSKQLFKKLSWGGAKGLCAGLASLGVLLVHVAIGYNHGSYKLAGLAFVFAMMSVLMQLFGSILYYRYLLIRKHPNWFIYERTSGKKNRKGA